MLRSIYTTDYSDAFVYRSLQEQESKEYHFYKIYSNRDFVDNKIRLEKGVDEFTGFNIYPYSKAEYRVLSRVNNSPKLTTLQQGSVPVDGVVDFSVRPRDIEGQVFLEIVDNAGPVQLHYLYYP